MNQTVISNDELDELVEQKLIQMMKANSPKLIQVFIVQMGREAVAANATTLEMSLEADIKGERYKIKSVLDVEKVNKEQSP